jgi:hypothetical protein
MPVKQRPASQAIQKLDVKAKGLFKENVQQYVDTFGGSLPPGEYRCRLSQAMLYLNRNNEPQVDFVFVVSDGDQEGQQIRDMHTIAERGKRTIPLALRIVAGRLQNLGHKTDDVANAGALDNHLKKLSAECPEVVITIKDDQYGGVGRLRLAAGQDGQAAEEQDETSAEAGDEGESEGEEAQLEVGSKVEVNDPNDDDSPWTGTVTAINNDNEVEVQQDETDDTWVVQVKHISLLLSEE